MKLTFNLILLEAKALGKYFLECYWLTWFVAVIPMSAFWYQFVFFLFYNFVFSMLHAFVFQTEPAAIDTSLLSLCFLHNNPFHYRRFARFFICHIWFESVQLLGYFVGKIGVMIILSIFPIRFSATKVQLFVNIFNFFLFDLIYFLA